MSTTSRLVEPPGMIERGLIALECHGQCALGVRYRAPRQQRQTCKRMLRPSFPGDAPLVLDNVTQARIGIRQVTLILRQNPTIDMDLTGDRLSPRDIVERGNRGKRTINVAKSELRASDIE